MTSIDSKQDFQRILVICTRQIGDILLATPLIHAARQRWPRARIDVLGFEGTLGMLAGNPDVSTLIEAKAGARWRDAWPLVKRLWRHYDLAVTTQRSDREYIIGWLAGRVRVGLHPGYRPRDAWKRWLLHHMVPDSEESLHIAVEKLKLLEPWLPAPARIEVVPPPPIDLPASLAQRLRSGFVVVHIPSMWRYKQWPVAHFRQVIAAVAALGRQVVLTGGPSPADRRQVAECMAGLGPGLDVIDASGQLSLNQLSRLLADASLYIGPDTSITHLAAACNVPVVTVFGPTNPVVWGPWPQGAGGPSPFIVRGWTQSAGPVHLLQGSQPCVPCRREGCDRHRDSRSDCLETMAPERVITLTRRLLAGADADPGAPAHAPTV